MLCFSVIQKSRCSGHRKLFIEFARLPGSYFLSSRLSTHHTWTPQKCFITYTHAHTHACTHTHARTHARTHAHTHERTHTYTPHANAHRILISYLHSHLSTNTKRINSGLVTNDLVHWVTKPCRQKAVTVYLYWVIVMQNRENEYLISFLIGWPENIFDPVSKSSWTLCFGLFQSRRWTNTWPHGYNINPQANWKR